MTSLWNLENGTTSEAHSLTGAKLLKYSLLGTVKEEGRNWKVTCFLITADNMYKFNWIEIVSSRT